MIPVYTDCHLLCIIGELKADEVTFTSHIEDVFHFLDVEVRQLGWPVQSGNGAGFRADAGCRCLRGDERAVLPVGRGAEEPGTGHLRVAKEILVTSCQVL